jgi:pantoate--beta-alanine ligase
MYASDAQVSVNPGPLATRWEGEVRPGHFAGVATVVTKLLSIVRPDLAFFGEKDYQQYCLVRRMAADLDLGAGIIGVPIMREPDGLALSSRNRYLSAAERQRALALSESLEAASAALAWGERDPRALEAAMRDAIGERAQIDYAAVVDAETLEPLADFGRAARAIIAARVGSTRLIDNCALVPPAEVGGGR